MNIENGIITRRCSKCNIIKPIEEFAKNKSKPLNREYYCYGCKKLFSNAYRNKKVYYICECGKKVERCTKSKHIKSKKHMFLLKNLSEKEENQANTIKNS